MLNNNIYESARPLPPPSTDLPAPVLQSSLFDQDWQVGEEDSDSTGYGANLSIDSFIKVFTGPRGSGKTTLMTLFAIRCWHLYRSRILSNYPIEFYYKRPGEKLEHVCVEMLDWEKLLVFDQEYRNCLILLDEAPDVVSNLASMTWRNRLLNIFVRQIRKNRNSLFMAAQQIELIDKALRWQVDLEIQCADASRRYGWHAANRGECILLTVLDHSGLWTGTTSEERARMGQQYFWQGAAYPRFLWGQPGKTKPVFDTYYVQDVFESLRKVDMRLQSYRIGPGQPDISESKAFDSAGQVIASIMQSGNTRVVTKQFFEAIGEMTPWEKDQIAKKMAQAGVRNTHSGAKQFYDFSEFNMERFNTKGGE